MKGCKKIGQYVFKDGIRVEFWFEKIFKRVLFSMHASYKIPDDRMIQLREYGIKTAEKIEEKFIIKINEQNQPSFKRR